MSEQNLFEGESGGRFKVGDIVVGNKEADGEYRVTRKGWKGEVVDVSPDGKITVKELGSVKAFGHTVEGQYFDLLSEPEPEAPIVERKKEETKEPSELPIYVEEDKGKVLIIETEIDKVPPTLNRQLVPPAEKFAHFTLDKNTLEILDKVATAVELREPCLLEGPTSTSKTSSIEYLGMLTNNEVVRLNLNGQTDTSELVGKFVPNDGHLQIEFDSLLQNRDILTAESKKILGLAEEKTRSLTLFESQKIASLEGLEIPEWIWQDGLIPKAMKSGQWVVLDEINLAEPQILERLNPVLERNPSIVLSENSGLKIGENGDFPVHKDFRIFATMNPSDYTGRLVMSPAYKDRWVSYKFVQRPTLEEYLAMMNFMAFGEQPEVEILGRRYQGENKKPVFETLGKVSEIGTFFARLAKFQVELEDLSERRVIGKERKERYVFTRRSLIELMDYLETKSLVDRKTGRRITIEDNPQKIIQRGITYYYLDKIGSEDDRTKVTDLLEALGIGERNWTLGAADSEPPKSEVPEKTLEPKAYLDSFFEYTEKNFPAWNKRGIWRWKKSADGKFINMYVGDSVDKLPVDLAPKEESIFLPGEWGDDSSGERQLMKLLEGKKIYPFKFGGQLYLKIH